MAKVPTPKLAKPKLTAKQLAEKRIAFLEAKVNKLIRWAKTVEAAEPDLVVRKFNSHVASLGQRIDRVEDRVVQLASVDQNQRILQMASIERRLSALEQSGD